MSSALHILSGLIDLSCNTVIIKGTQVYDSGQGKFVDLSVLDVLQIFGRAGRPGLETSGEGFICTNIDTLDHYLDAVTAQVPLYLILSHHHTNSFHLIAPY